MKNCIWIDSEMECEGRDSRMDDSLFRINTSTFSNHRTAQHISNRLQDASQRLQNVSYTIHKRNLSSSIKSSNIHSQNHLNINSQEQLKPQQLVRIIKELSEQNSRKTDMVEQLQDRIVQIQNKQIKQQEKYLIAQNKYIQEINKLMNLLNMKEQDQAKWSQERQNLNNIIQEINSKYKKKEAQTQKDKNMEMETLKRQRDQIWKWSSMLSNPKTDKINMLKEQLQQRLQDLNYSINETNNKENHYDNNNTNINTNRNNNNNNNNNYNSMNLNGIINQSTMKQKRHKGKDNGNPQDNESLLSFLLAQAECIEKLL